MTNAVCAGIVLYNPQIARLRTNIDAIFQQVPLIILVDNGSDNLDEIEKLKLEFNSVVLISNNVNLGIAFALNQICDEADHNGFEWVLTLDQDTVCPISLIDTLYKHIGKDVGIVCPAVYEGWDIEKKQEINSVEEISACMTSASLTRISAWKKVAGFRTDYFIDFVDNEFCMKLRNERFKIIRVNDCSISHELGDSKTIKLFGLFPIRCSEHKPWRFYYMARNNIVFIREYKEYLCVPKEYMKLVYVLATGLLASKQKKETVHHIKMGIQHAKNMRMGRLEA